MGKIYREWLLGIKVMVGDKDTTLSVGFWFFSISLTFTKKSQPK